MSLKVVTDSNTNNLYGFFVQTDNDHPVGNNLKELQSLKGESLNLTNLDFHFRPENGKSIFVLIYKKDGNVKYLEAFSNKRFLARGINNWKNHLTKVCEVNNDDFCFVKAWVGRVMSSDREQKGGILVENATDHSGVNPVDNSTALSNLPERPQNSNNNRPPPQRNHRAHPVQYTMVPMPVGYRGGHMEMNGGFNGGGRGFNGGGGNRGPPSASM